MTWHLTQLPRLIVERRSSAIFGIVIIAMLWAGIAWKYLGDLHDDRREAERTNQNFAMVFEENVLRSLSDESHALTSKEKANVEETLRTMESKYGYCEACAKDAIIFLVRERYS